MSLTKLIVCYSNKCQEHIKSNGENEFIFKIHDNKYHISNIAEYLKESFEAYDLYKGENKQTLTDNEEGEYALQWEDITKIIDKANTIIFHIEK
jgi:hypothetical protein